MQRILFLRDYRPPSRDAVRTNGSHIKVRDYFVHCLHHPDIEPYLYLTPRSDLSAGDVWLGVPPERIVHKIEPAQYDLFFVTDKDWKLLPEDRGGARLIHYLQSLEHCDPAHRNFRYLRRAAFRICVSAAVERASAPHRRGDAVVIEDGIPLDLFAPAKGKEAGSIVIWGRKQQELGVALRDALGERGIPATLLLDYMSRHDFAQQLATADIFIGLPKHTEGFFLPALEAMACGCAVICPDAIGNHSFCVDGETCLMPPRDEIAAYLACVERLRADDALREGIRTRGLETARAHSLESEREQFHRFLDRFVLVPAG